MELAGRWAGAVAEPVEGGREGGLEISAELLYFRN